MAGLVRGVKLLNLAACSRFLLRSSYHRSLGISYKTQEYRCGLTKGQIPYFLARQLSTTSLQAPVSNRRQENEHDEVTDRTARLQGQGRRLLLNLNNQVQNRGRVDGEQVKELLEVFKKEGDVASQEALMLLRCCGSLLVKESQERRHNIFQMVWKQFSDMGMVFDISHYNTALRIKLENEVPFSVTSVLEEIEGNHLIPNRVTYQLFIARYCEDGDIEGAKKILEFMQSRQMSVNEAVFHTLIIGHMRAGDEESARKVLDSMRYAGLEPSAVTYRMLMVGYAEKGDINSIVKTATEAEKDEVMLHARQYLDAAVALVRNGHSEHLSQILSMIPVGRFNQDMQNCAYQLVAHGYEDEALEVFSCMTSQGVTSEVQGSGSSTSSRALLQTMVANNRPLDKIFMLHEKMKDMGVNNDGIEYLTNTALRLGQAGMSLDLLKKMKDQGIPVRPHYYMPVFIAYKNDQDVDGICKAVQHLQTCVPWSEEDIFPTIYINAVQKLKDLNVPVDTIIEKFKAHGMGDKTCNGIQATVLVEKANIKEALEFARSNPSVLSPGVLKTRLINAFFRGDKDWASLVDMMALMQQAQGRPFAELNGRILTAITKPGCLESSQLEAVMNKWLEKNLPLANKYYVDINKNLDDTTVSPEIKQKLNDVFTTIEGKTLPRAPAFVPKGGTLMGKSIKELEAMYEDAQQRKINVLSLEKWMLSKYASAGEVEKATHMKAQLDGKGFVYAAELLRQLGLMAAIHKGNLEEALEYKKQMESQYPKYSPYGHFVLTVAHLYLEKGDLEAALSIMQDYRSRHKQSMEAAALEENYNLSQVGSNIVSMAGKSLGPDAAHKVMEALFDLGYLKAGTFSVLEEYVKTTLNNGDLDEAVNALDHCVKTYERAPYYSELFRKLIEIEDADRLQKVVDMVTSIQREMSVLHSLICAFIECGKPKQARKIVETPGLRAIMPALISGCNRFVTHGMTKELELLVDITKTLFGVDRDEMLFQLIRGHVRQGNLEQAVDTYHLYEEQNVMPRPRTLRYLAKVLENAGKQEMCPFPTPVDKKMSSKFELEAGNSKEEEATKAVQNGNIDAIKALLSQSSTGEDELRSKFLTQVLKYFLQKKQKNEFKQLVHTLGDIGSLDTLLQVREMDMSVLLQRFVDQRLFGAYIIKDRSNEILDYLEKNPALVSNYSHTNSLVLLAKRNPELIPRLDELICKYTDSAKNTEAVNHLFNMYYITGQFAQGDKLLQKYPDLSSKLKTITICREARALGNESIMFHLIETLRPNGPVKLSLIYSELIMMKCNESDWKTGLSYFEQAKAEGLKLENMWAVALNKLESLLKENNQPLPWAEDSLAQFSRRTNSKDVSAESSDVSAEAFVRS